MRKQLANSRLIHYALLVLSLSAATVGGLVLLGCISSDMADVTVADPEQRDPNGGVVFHRSENKPQAQVSLPTTVAGQPVTWTVLGSSTLGEILDPNKSNELTVNMSEVAGYTNVNLRGVYTTPDGSYREIYVYVPVHTEN